MKVENARKKTIAKNGIIFGFFHLMFARDCIILK
jgi:hypothetical protein